MGRFLLVLLLALAIGGWMFLRWFRRTPPEKVAATLRKAAVWGAAGLLLLLVATGRIHWLYAVVGGALPAVQRLVGLLRLARMLRAVRGSLGLGGGAAQAAPERSEVVTPWLRVVLEHGTGELAGEVLAGRFAGRRLESLSLEELRALYAEVAGDEESRRLLEAWLDRIHGPGWREAEGRRSPADGDMTPEEAYAVLGLEPGASPEEIRAAHRRLMQRLHPDRGGSDFLAASINRAKAVLLGE